MDALEYLGLATCDQIVDLANRYDPDKIKDFHDCKEYYAQLGMEQIARQVWFHHTMGAQMQNEMYSDMVKDGDTNYGVDFGCGSAPVAFEWLRRGHRVDFVDVPGSAAYEFCKWRVAKHGLSDRAGWALKGVYDYALMLDSIEHIEDWRGTLQEILDAVKVKGVLITNYFINVDHDNPEHISMCHNDVREFLTGNNMQELNAYVWQKV